MNIKQLKKDVEYFDHLPPKEEIVFYNKAPERISKLIETIEKMEKILIDALEDDFLEDHSSGCWQLDAEKILDECEEAQEVLKWRGE